MKLAFNSLWEQFYFMPAVHPKQLVLGRLFQIPLKCLALLQQKDKQLEDISWLIMFVCGHQTGKHHCSLCLVKLNKLGFPKILYGAMILGIGLCKEQNQKKRTVCPTKPLNKVSVIEVLWADTIRILIKYPRNHIDTLRKLLQTTHSRLQTVQPQDQTIARSFLVIQKQTRKYSSRQPMQHDPDQPSGIASCPTILLWDGLYLTVPVEFNVHPPFETLQLDTQSMRKRP